MRHSCFEQRWGPSRLVQGKVRFRLWAPAQPLVSLEVDGVATPMAALENGWFETIIDDREHDIEYVFVFADGTTVTDPASRSQPQGLRGRSVFPRSRSENGPTWQGRPWTEAVIYEIHIGTFTEEGTFSAAAKRLQHLAELGFTAIELMPLAQFPGTRGWGYDGVLQFAPHNAYGSPAALQSLIDQAHALGMMVFLDVVYNHFGPEGNHLNQYAPQFYHADKQTPWGDAINYEVDAVRSYFIENALYWLGEFRFDGLRFDAIDYIDDASDYHLLEEISHLVTQRFGGRYIHLITENPKNSTDLLVMRDDAGKLYQADWNDAFHHALHVATTGEKEGHYEEFQDNPWQKVREIMARGYLEIGGAITRYSGPQQLPLPTTCFINFLQNHDQVGNRAFGERLNTLVGSEVYRTMTELLLLSPHIPLVFMGDDHNSKQSFGFFTDYQGEIASVIRNSRPVEAEKFGGIPQGRSKSDIADPNALETFNNSKLSWEDLESATGQLWSEHIKLLLFTRRKKILPLLSEGIAINGVVIDAPQKCVFIDWPFPAGTLQLRANFSEIPVRLEEEIIPIFPALCDARCEVEAMSVVVAIAKKIETVDLFQVCIARNT